jgi:hypothetical protein
MAERAHARAARSPWPRDRPPSASGGAAAHALGDFDRDRSVKSWRITFTAAGERAPLPREQGRQAKSSAAICSSTRHCASDSPAASASARASGEGIGEPLQRRQRRAGLPETCLLSLRNIYLGNNHLEQS